MKLLNATDEKLHALLTVFLSVIVDYNFLRNNPNIFLMRCRGLTGDSALERISIGLALPGGGNCPRADGVSRAWNLYRAPTLLKLLQMYPRMHR